MRRPWSNNNGQALVELALALPLLIILFLGIFDVCRYQLTKNAITNMTREGANLASRTQMSRQDIVNLLAFSNRAVDMPTRGTMYISEVTGGDGSSAPIIGSQVIYGTTTSVSKIADTVSTLGLTLSPNQTVYVVEIFYTYESLFSAPVERLLSLPAKSWLSQPIYSQTIM